MTHEDEKDGCGLDFKPHAIKPEQVEDFLIPEGEEEDEDDA